MNEKHRVRMKRTQIGRDDDALQAQVFRAGEVYFIGASLYRVFVDDLQCAEPVRETKDIRPEAAKVRKPRARK